MSRTGIATLIMLFAGCTARPLYTSRDSRSSAVIGTFHEYQHGEASYYAHKFHGRKTANGEIFDMHKLTAAHLKLPFNTLVRVTNLSNNKTVIVRINDRGPYAKGRIIDLSLAAAKELDMMKSGVAKVRLEIVKKEE